VRFESVGVRFWVEGTGCRVQGVGVRLKGSDPGLGCQAKARETF
jgi:hypothetical protein